jgi:hypothetical protein
LRGIGPIEKALTSKLDIIGELTGKFPAEPGSIFTGNAVLPTAPSRRGMLTGQKLRAHA